MAGGRVGVAGVGEEINFWRIQNRKRLWGSKEEDNDVDDNYNVIGRLNCLCLVHL